MGKLIEQENNSYVLARTLSRVPLFFFIAMLLLFIVVYFAKDTAIGSAVVSILSFFMLLLYFFLPFTIIIFSYIPIMALVSTILLFKGKASGNKFPKDYKLILAGNLLILFFTPGFLIVISKNPFA